MVVDYNIKRAFFEFVNDRSGYFHNRNIYIKKNDHPNSLYYNEAFLLDLSNEIFSDLEFINNPLVSNDYIVVTKYKDEYETIRDYFNYDIKNNKFIEVSSNNYDSIQSLEDWSDYWEDSFDILLRFDYNDFLNLIEKINKVFKKINESNIDNSELSDVKMSFSKFATDSEFSRRCEYYKKKYGNELPRSGAGYDQVYNILFLIDIKDFLFNTNNEVYSPYIIKNVWSNDYEKLTEYYNYNHKTGNFDHISKSDADILERLDDFNYIEDYYDLILKFDYDDYFKLKSTTHRTMKKINEEVGSNFQQAKLEFLEFASEKFRKPMLRYDRLRKSVYELCKYQGLYVVFIIGKLGDEEFYYDDGYIYGRYGWEFHDDMGIIMRGLDKMKKVLRYGYQDYLNNKNKTRRVVKRINENNILNFKNFLKPH